MVRFIKYIAPIFYYFMAGVFFEDFMHSNRLDRILSAVLFLMGGIACSIYPYDEKKKDEHIFEFEKETQPPTQTIPSGSNTVTNTEEK